MCRCDECLATHVLDSKGVCQKLPKGQYKDRITDMARPCPPNALSCTDIGRQQAKITLCEAPLKIKQNETDTRKYECTLSGRSITCAPGFVAVDRSNEEWCVECPVKAGYYLDGSECKRCPAFLHALKCKLERGEVRPVECEAGYREYQATLAAASQCVECPDSCETCLNELLAAAAAKRLQCARCRRGYYVAAGGECVPCPGQQCEACSTGDACDECGNGYRRDQHTRLCAPCPINCAVCDDQQCLQCHTGFAAIGEQDYYYCGPCTSNCLQCVFLQCT